MSVKFINIRLFACEHFYFWDEGNAFSWIMKEWPKFEPFFKKKKEAITFIKCLSSIYDNFCHSAYFETTVPSIETFNKEIESGKDSMLTWENIDNTLNIILDVYKMPTEVHREFSTIKMDWVLPSSEAISFIFDVFKKHWDIENGRILNKDESEKLQKDEDFFDENPF